MQAIQYRSYGDYSEKLMFDIAMPLFETEDVRRGLPSAVAALKEGRPRPPMDFKGR